MPEKKTNYDKVAGYLIDRIADLEKECGELKRSLNACRDARLLDAVKSAGKTADLRKTLKPTLFHDYAKDGHPVNGISMSCTIVNDTEKAQRIMELLGMDGEEQ